MGAIVADQERQIVEPAAPQPPPEPPDPERVQEICSLLIANGFLPVQKFRDLLYNESLRRQVEARLDTVGQKLLFNPYSEYWGVGLNEKTASDDRLEWSNNFGLDRGAMALLLIIWAKLVLPKRLAQEERQPQDGSVAALFPEIEAMPQPRPSISRDQIMAEFGELLGGVIMTQKYIAQLARARLIKAHGGTIEEGPLLALVIDERLLTEELRREVLLSVLRREASAKAPATATDRPAAAEKTDDEAEAAPPAAAQAAPAAAAADATAADEDDEADTDKAEN